MCYILGLGGCRARDDHAAPRLAGETCSILANQPQLGLAAADPPESGFVGSVGLGLQCVRVSRAEEMRRRVRGRRTEGRFSADRPVHESPQDARSWVWKSNRATPKQKVALELIQNPRARAQCGGQYAHYADLTRPYAGVTRTFRGNHAGLYAHYADVTRTLRGRYAL